MASSSSTSTIIREYDVFLSFQGKDTRHTIVSHLYEALCLKGLHTFRDDERIVVGDKISDGLVKAINTSWFAVVIISVNYATSSWCLEELRTIMELYAGNNIAVVPIFFGVEPSDVRSQTGKFGTAFERYSAPEMADKVLQWREALTQVCDLAGMHGSQCVNEAEMVAKVVGTISTQLRIMKPTEMRNFVGMEDHMTRMDILLGLETLDEVRIIGILGMGGIGKTTIAKCLYAQFSHLYEAHCFIENVWKIYNDHGAKQLQTVMLSDTTHDGNIKLWSVEAGYTAIMARLGHKKVFLVLDGVDKWEQIQALTRERSWFGPGSRIIITTRDRGLLNACKVDGIHEVKCLDDKDALKIFKEAAFRDVEPLSDSFEQLSVRASQLAHGLPSALVAFGSHLSKKTTISSWEKELDVLESSPHDDVKKIMVASYNGLGHRDKIVFLHVACLFNKGYRKNIITFFDNGDSRLDHLAEMSLIDITPSGCVNMHFLIVQVGKDIVCEEAGLRPSEQRVLWDANEIYGMLDNNIVSDKTEGLSLHTCEIANRLPMRSIGFSTMRNLKFLKFFQHVGDMEYHMQLDGTGLSYNLKLLYWDAYPSTCLPSNFRMDTLVEITLRNSNLVNLWSEPQWLRSLRKLDVTGSKNLIKLPDLSSAVNLEELVMEGCKSLKSIQGSIHGLNLRKLNMIRCDSLKGLLYVTLLHEINPSSKSRYKIEVRFSQETTRTLSFPTELSIEGTILVQLLGLSGDAEHLSFSTAKIGVAGRTVTPLLMSDSDLNGSDSLTIKKFNYSKGTFFRCYSFSELAYLTELKLINLNIQVIPDDIDHLKLLKKLDLSGNDFTYLPLTMQFLAMLKYLKLHNCPYLEAFPQLTQVKSVILSDCVNLFHVEEKEARNRVHEIWRGESKIVHTLSNQLDWFYSLAYLDLSRNDFRTLPSNIGCLSSLKTLLVNNCKKLESLEDLPYNIKYLYAHGCESLMSLSLFRLISPKHLDLSHCFNLNHTSMDHIESLLEQYSFKEEQVVTQAFICFPRTRDSISNDNRAHETSARINIGQISTEPSSQVFAIAVDIVSEDCFQLQFPAFSYYLNWESSSVLLVYLKPRIYLSLEKRKDKDVLTHHTVSIHIPTIIKKGGEFHFKPHLLLPEEFQFANVVIRSCRVEIEYSKSLVAKKISAPSTSLRAPQMVKRNSNSSKETNSTYGRRIGRFPSKEKGILGPRPKQSEGPHLLQRPASDQSKAHPKSTSSLRLQQLPTNQQRHTSEIAKNNHNNNKDKAKGKSIQQ